MRDGPPRADEADLWKKFVPLMLHHFWEFCRRDPRRHPGGIPARSSGARRRQGSLGVIPHARACRDVSELRYLARQLFTRWIAPVREGMIEPHEYPKLVKTSKPIFADARTRVYARDHATESGPLGAAADLAGLRLPTCTKYLLVAAYLASRFSNTLDVALFSRARRTATTCGRGKRVKRPAPAETPHIFPLERLMAIFASARRDRAGIARRDCGLRLRSPCSQIRSDEMSVPSSEVHTQLGALMRKRLVARVSSAEVRGGLCMHDVCSPPRGDPLGTRMQVLDGIRLRCEAPAPLVTTVAREVGFDLSHFS